MFQKEIRREHSAGNSQHKSHGLSPEKIFLFSGEGFLLLILLYFVISNGGANEALHLWLPFVLAGIALFITIKVIR